jgi:hypothetical protein
VTDRRAAGPRGRSTWAPRLAVLSTVLLVACFAVSGPARSLLAFGWVSMTLLAMVLEWVARRQSDRTPARTPPERARRGRRRASS